MSDTSILLLILFPIGIAAIAFAVYRSRQQQKRLQQAWNAYQYALQNMHADASMRAQVVNYGRAYYGMVRGGAVSIYDEMAISNDIKQAGG